MNGFHFVPDEPAISQVQVPFYEDVRSDDMPGYRTDKSESVLQAEVVELITRLGGGAASFQAGTFGGSPKRYGYIISFSVMGTGGQGVNCRMYVAGLPLKQAETELKKSQVKRHALFAFRDYLRGELNALMMRPGYSPFVPHMVLPSGRTIGEEMVEQFALLAEGGALLLPGGGR